MQDTTNVPQLPPYVQGVINLRGRVIPVVSLRLKFGLGEGETTHRTCSVVVEVRGESGDPAAVGVMVDGVNEVMTFVPADLEQPPDFGRGKSIPYLLGMAKVKGKVKILLDIDYVLGQEEVLGLQAALAA
jgi:purine-binding chemotaxis protein CheW